MNFRRIYIWIGSFFTIFFLTIPARITSAYFTADVVPETMTTITTTPDVRHIHAADGIHTDWLRVEPFSAEAAQEHILEIILQFTTVEGTVVVNVYEDISHRVALDQKTICAPATIIFQSASISPYELEIMASTPGSQAEYAVIYALRPQLRPGRQSHTLSDATVTMSQSPRFLERIRPLSLRTFLLLCLGIAACVSLIAVLSLLLALTKKRLRQIMPVHATEVLLEDYHLLGDLASLHGKEQLARRCYSRAALEPNNTSVHCELGKFLFQEKRYAEAIKEFQIALNGEPIPLEIDHYLAFSYLALNQIKQAEYYYEKSLKHQASEFTEDALDDDGRKTECPSRIFSASSGESNRKGVTA
ncbi:Tfp pilus assembly protein PilF [Candidatus Moduliflexus flocculans]|uniref:Tfp pilus assembly protein PilF n=1 Tax=Candidatus Moduliflexus flocculans TaxID=1499966 RepID=A0A0S6VPJ2_9BACT|nr:Tfp pilus assembly protein PilF [Candidatus Moduliflexus flocculans]